MPNIDRLQQTEKKKGESIHRLVCNMEKLCDNFPCIHCLLSPTPYTCMILEVCNLITVKLSLYYCFLISSGMLSLSGNSNLEDAINWIAEHEDDPDIDQMPLVQYFLSPIFCGYVTVMLHIFTSFILPHATSHLNSITIVLDCNRIFVFGQCITSRLL